MSVPSLQSVMWYQNMAEVYKRTKTADKWATDAFTMSLRYNGVTNIVIEYEHPCKDCGTTTWQQCNCLDLDKCKLYPLCKPCWNKRVNSVL